MKPEQRSKVLLGITRSKGKMFEYDIPDRYHNLARASYRKRLPMPKSIDRHKRL
jgi:hypothetical protein